MLKNTKAQSVLEYVIVLTVIILALLFSSRNNGGPMRDGLTHYFNGIGAGFQNAANQF